MGDRRNAPGSPAPASRDESPVSFEEALEELEGIVLRLEQGDLPLEEALGAFEQGVALTKRCASQLDDAERRIEVLVREGERSVERPFEADEEPED